MTAITTAGLLAGLFGSAFVPAARAAATGDPATVTATKLTATNVLGTGTAARPFAKATADAFAGMAIDLAVTDFAGAVANADPLTYTASTGFHVGVTNAACTAATKGTTSTVSATLSAGGLACLTVSAASLTQAASVGTVTISSVNGVIKTLYVANLGAVASLTIAKVATYSSYIAISNTAVANYLTFIAKDSAGTTIESVVAADLTLTNTTAGTAYVDGTGVAGKLNIAASACNGTKVSGDTISVSVTHTATLVASNVLTLTCTGGVDSISEIVLYHPVTGASVGGTAGTLKTVNVYAIVVDAAGRPVGEGASTMKFTGTAGVFAGTASAVVEADHITFSPIKVAAATNITAGNGTDFTGERATDVVPVYNEVSLGVWTFRTDGYGSQSIQVTVPNNELTSAAAGALATEAKFSATYTTIDFLGGVGGSASIAASANKRVATVTISAAAGKLVTITIEKTTTGKTWTYYRKANASGVATFTLRRLGKFDVFASYGDDVTDTVRMRR